MEATTITNSNPKAINVLLVGNNPLELSDVHESLKSFQGTKYISEIAFDLKNTFSRVLAFKPSYILIDDNLGSRRVKKLVHKLIHNNKTRDIQVTILKNSNYSEVMTEGVQDYILKENFSADSFYKSIRNSARLRRTQLYLHKYYRKGKGKLARALEKFMVSE